MGRRALRRRQLLTVQPSRTRARHHRRPNRTILPRCCSRQRRQRLECGGAPTKCPHRRPFVLASECAVGDPSPPEYNTRLRSVGNVATIGTSAAARGIREERGNGTLPVNDTDGSSFLLFTRPRLRRRWHPELTGSAAPDYYNVSSSPRPRHRAPDFAQFIDTSLAAQRSWTRPINKFR